MRYIIPYSFSQQNEFYKVYNTKEKKKKRKKLTVPQNCFDFTASVPLRNIYTDVENVCPLRRVYHNYLQLTGSLENFRTYQ